MVNRAEIDTADADLSVLDGFSDLDEAVSESRKRVLAAAVERGIVHGFEDGTLRLDEDVTRAEFSCFIYRTKDCFTPPTGLVTYHGAYGDIADWHRAETVYCIENGFLMGYGDAFGSDDLISEEQVNLVADRMQYGLTTREKYTLLEVCWASPISMSVISDSAYDPAIKALIHPKSKYEYEPGYTKADDDIQSNNYVLTDVQELAQARLTVAEELTSLFEKIHDLNAVRLTDEPYRRRVVEPFRRILYRDYTTGIDQYYWIPITVNNGEPTDINAIVDNATACEMQRESILALSSENCRMYMYGKGLLGYQLYCGAGYEYFCYQSEGGIPEGLKVGIWYRRTVSMLCEYATSNRLTGDWLPRLFITYGEPKIVFR